MHQITRDLVQFKYGKRLMFSNATAHKQTLNPDGLRFPHRKIASYAMLVIAFNNRKPRAIEASDFDDHTARCYSTQ